MLKIEIRQGTEKDATLITGLIKNMVDEMAQYGGHAVNHSQEIWSSMEALVKANIACKEYLYLIASQELPVSTTIGLAAANIELLENIFVAKMRLHLSAIYTVPNMRRQGVARQLIQNVLEWGQHMNAVEADLNVLVPNPARRLYENLGFEPHEISLVKKLSSDLSK